VWRVSENTTRLPSGDQDGSRPRVSFIRPEPSAHIVQISISSHSNAIFWALGDQQGSVSWTWGVLVSRCSHWPSGVMM